MPNEYKPVNVCNGEYKFHAFPDAWLRQVDDEKFIMSLQYYHYKDIYPSERPVYYYNEDRFSTYEKLTGFSIENTDEDVEHVQLALEEFQEHFENKFQTLDKKDFITTPFRELEVDEEDDENKISLSDYDNSDILVNNELEFSYSCQWENYELSVWGMGELYVVADKNKHEIISFVYDDTLSLQEGDGDTAVYLLNEKDLIVVNNGDVSSIVFIKKN